MKNKLITDAGRKRIDHIQHSCSYIDPSLYISILTKNDNIILNLLSYVPI